MDGEREFASFGRIRPAGGRRALGGDAALAGLKAGGNSSGGLLAYGNGRSYGDSCLNDTGVLADMRSLNAIGAVDAESGVIEVGAGALLADIIAAAAPTGWFLPVTPGTQFVTAGGAIANDVHGKNHHRRGSFGHHVESLVLARSDGSVRTCSATENTALFRATIGGMGLTGIIVSARIRLMKVPSLDVEERVRPFASLDAYFDMAEDADKENEYAVAWIDQLAGGSHSGRGVLLTGNHAQNGNFGGSHRPARLSVPFQPPVCVLNRPFLKLFNLAYRTAKARNRGPHVAGWRSFFYPLDGVRHWNRLYGPRGLYQHQSVIPGDAARQTVPQLLEAARRAEQGSFLTVLKRFGNHEAAGLLSFARPGYTLTLDFPNAGARTLAMLDELDRITIGAGGAVNPYKDARMSASVFEASFPNWRALEALRDPAFASDFWRRTAFALGAGAGATAAAAE